MVSLLIHSSSHSFSCQNSQVSDDLLLQGGGDWTNVIIPGKLDSDSFNHRQSYEITNLRPDAEYECLVQARNRFGWSEASRIFHFYSGKRGQLIKPFAWSSSVTHYLTAVEQ